jgi:redox-sensitive bicupin YhaK (pirin superfamily)
MVQLWVNLPKKDKMTAPGYQGIVDADIPAVALPDDAGTLRVIAGEHDGHSGPAHTYSPMNVWDVRLAAGKSVELPQPEGWTTLLIVLAGTVMVNGEAVLREKQVATLSTEGTGVTIEANGDAKLLLLAGEPIDEPVVGYGPFVMNSQQEIMQAIADFNGGKFGQMD